MSTIHCTQKLLTELRIKPGLVEPGNTTDLTNWHAKLLLIERRIRHFELETA